MPSGSTWSHSLLDECFRGCGEPGEFYFYHGAPCPGPAGQGPGRVALCRQCVREVCPFCGEPIEEDDFTSVTDKLPTVVTTRSTTDGIQDGSVHPEDCQWWRRQHPLLRHQHLWHGGSEAQAELYCTSCGKSYVEDQYICDPDDSELPPPVIRAGVAFAGSLPPQSCDCGGWLQIGVRDFGGFASQKLQAAMDSLLQQSTKRVASEPSFWLNQICLRLTDTHCVEQLLGIPALFQALNAVLPTLPYEQWADAHHCDLISAADALITVSGLLCAIANFIFPDMSIPLPERVAFLCRSPCVVSCDPKYARSVFGKLVTAANLFSAAALGTYMPAPSRGYPLDPRVLAPALRLFEVLGYRIYSWEASTHVDPYTPIAA